MRFDELIDIVSEKDLVIGSLYKHEAYERELKNFRVINAFVINSKNQILIPKRHPSKKLFPNCLDASVGGHVKSGESYREAFTRETFEELKLAKGSYEFEEIGKLSPIDHPVSAFMTLYLIKTDLAIDYNKEDISDCFYFSLNELDPIIEKKLPSKGDLPYLLTYLNHFLKRKS